MFVYGTVPVPVVTFLFFVDNVRTEDINNLHERNIHSVSLKISIFCPKNDEKKKIVYSDITSLFLEEHHQNQGDCLEFLN